MTRYGPDAPPTTGDPRIDIRLGNGPVELCLLKDKSLDMVLMDPPWMNTTLDMEDGLDVHSFRNLLVLMRDKLKPTGWLFCFGGIRLQQHILPLFEHKFEYVWIKPTPVMATHTTVRPSYQHEPIHAYHHPDLKQPKDLFFDREALRTRGHGNYPARKFARNKVTEYRAQQRVAIAGEVKGVQDGTRGPTSLLHFRAKQQLQPHERTDHPTQKPIALLETLVRGYCPPDGLVCDPFLGSGTTAIAARAAGRRFVGWELDPKWHALAVSRCSDPLFAAAAAGAAEGAAEPSKKKEVPASP